MRFAFLLLLTTLVVAGCAKTKSTTMKSYPARSASHPIEILSSLPSNRKYVEVALVDSQTGKHIFADRSSTGAIEQMKSEARKVGADALVIRGTSSGSYNWGQGGWGPAKADAIAIRWVQ